MCSYFALFLLLVVAQPRTQGQRLEHQMCQPFRDRSNQKVWTCADKTRVLLMAEDGSHHCIKF